MATLYATTCAGGDGIGVWRVRVGRGVGGVPGARGDDDIIRK